METDTRIDPRALIPPFRGKPGYFQYEARLEIPRIFHSHNKYRRLYAPLYRQSKVLLLVRNLRDAMASRYRKVTTAFGFDVPFNRFLRAHEADFHRGQSSSLGDRVNFLNGWGDHLGHPRGVMLVRYEDLKADPELWLLRVLAFLGLRGVNLAFCNGVVERCSIERMRAVEKTQLGKNVSIKKGAVGGYEQYFSPEDNEYFLAYVGRHLRHPFGYSYS